MAPSAVPQAARQAPAALKTAVTSGLAQYPQWGLSWTYDRYGNRTAQSVTHGSGPSNSVSVSATTNRITSMGAATFYYDSNGNLTQDDLYKYKYDAENRLVELRTLADALVASYATDGHGLRVVKVWGADRTFYIYAGGKLISEYEDAASNNYSAGTQPGSAGSESYSTFLYQHADHLTTRLTTDNSGQVSNQQAHYPYGESWYAGGGADWSVARKFTSYLKDGETGAGQVHYAVFRQYGARIGRYQMAAAMSEGSGTIPQSHNRYTELPWGTPPWTSGPCTTLPPTNLPGQDWPDFIPGFSCPFLYMYDCGRELGCGHTAPTREALCGQGGFGTPPFFPDSPHPGCGGPWPGGSDRDDWECYYTITGFRRHRMPDQCKKGQTGVASIYVAGSGVTQYGKVEILRVEVEQFDNLIRPLSRTARKIMVGVETSYEVGVVFLRDVRVSEYPRLTWTVIAVCKGTPIHRWLTVAAFSCQGGD